MIIILMKIFSIGSRRVAQQTTIHSRTLSLFPSLDCIENHGSIVKQVHDFVLHIHIGNISLFLESSTTYPYL